jgi:hypothetical protein
MEGQIVGMLTDPSWENFVALGIQILAIGIALYFLNAIKKFLGRQWYRRMTPYNHGELISVPTATGRAFMYIGEADEFGVHLITMPYERNGVSVRGEQIIPWDQLKPQVVGWQRVLENPVAELYEESEED